MQGDPVNSLKFVTAGWVKLYRVSPNGSEAILETLSSGQSFDEVAALLGGESYVSAEALGDCRVMHIELSAILSCETAYRELSQAVLSAALVNLGKMFSQIEQLKVRTGAQRLAHFLTEQVDAQDAINEVTLPYEKYVLAGMLGIKPESLSRAFKRLKPIGVKCVRDKITLNDVSALRAFIDQDPVNWPEAA